MTRVQSGALAGFYALLGAFPAYSESHYYYSQPLRSVDSRPVATSKSGPVGVDLNIAELISGITTVGACQGTPIAKNEIEGHPGKCRVALLSAAHCFGENPKGIGFDGGAIELTEACGPMIQIHQEYFNLRRGNEGTPGDSATVVFDTDCKKVSHLQIVPLAPTEKDGTTRLDSKKVSIQKRKSKVRGNIGGGKQIVADVLRTEEKMFEFYVPSPQGYAVVGGDSGGAILNEKGQLICPISASGYELKRINGKLRRPEEDGRSLLDPFFVTCDKRAIGRARQSLEKVGLSTDPNYKVDSEPCKLPKGSSDDPQFVNSGRDFLDGTRHITEAIEMSDPFLTTGVDRRLFRPELGTRYSEAHKDDEGRINLRSIEYAPLYEVVANDVGSIAGANGRAFPGHEAGTIFRNIRTQQYFYINGRIGSEPIWVPVRKDGSQWTTDGAGPIKPEN